MGSVSCPSCGSTIVGAGEALCALTHSNANLYYDSFTSNVSDAPDEVKSFRNKGCNLPAAPPSPRTSPSIKVFFALLVIKLDIRFLNWMCISYLNLDVQSVK